MKIRLFFIVAVVLTISFDTYSQDNYKPAPENLAARQWFQDAKFGLFIHWGVYSTLASGEWVMYQQKLDKATYEKLQAEQRKPIDTIVVLEFLLQLKV